LNLWPTVEVARGIHQIWQPWARVTVITGGPEVVLVDTGWKGGMGTLKSGLKALGIAPTDIGLIVLTHYHPDHTGSLDRVVEATGASVAVHGEEAAIVTGEEARPSPFRSRLLAAASSPVVDRLYGLPARVDVHMADGDLLPVRPRIRAIHTPGHTSGSTCLLVEDSKTLIVGDALQYHFGRLLPPARMVTQDMRQAEESVRKLSGFDFDTICFGHFRPLRGQAREAVTRLTRRLDAKRPVPA
jgi:glyoxylase-like metal-dependent hydrolase (beta-lactamase superfamily II)